MSRRRCRLAMKVSESEKSLLAFFKGGGPKGNFYPKLYLRLLDFFAAEETVDLPEKQRSEAIHFNLWFDLTEPLHVDIKTKLSMCNYSEEVKTVIRDFAVGYAKRNVPTASVKTASTKSLKVKHTHALTPIKKKSSAQEVTDEKVENHSSVEIPKLAELSFDSHTDPESRLRLLEQALVSHPDVSPGGGRQVLKWAHTVEGYLSGTAGDTPAELEAASDKQSFVYDFVRECPYLGALQEKAVTQSNVAAAMRGKEKVEAGKNSLPRKGKRDFTQALLGMSSE